MTEPSGPVTGPIWTRHLRREVQYLLDLSILAAALVLAYLLRFDFQVPAVHRKAALVQLPLVVLIQFVCVFALGAYHFVWRYIGMAEVRTFVRFAVISATPLVIMRLGLPETFGPWKVPLSIILLDTVFAFCGLLGIRILRRALYERYERTRRRGKSTSSRRRRTLLLGAGRAGLMAVREIEGRGDSSLELVGFVDDDVSKRGSVIHGLKVLGTTEELPQIAGKLHIDEIVITIAEADSATMRRLVRSCERIGARVRIIPGLFEILQGNVSITRFRDVGIEDLLGRETVRLDEAEVRRFLTAKTVMVTGCGGSIGSELVRQAARFAPSRVLLLERAEGALFEIERELRELWPSLECVPLVADAGDPVRLAAILSEYRPHAVFHAAAHKHVPMMEANVSEAVRNNVLATHTLGRLAGEHGCEAVVLISTDKAVQPTSVMGATKRLAELVIQDLDRQFAATRFLAVRFGNVMGSAGSVVPIFREQIARGGPVTVTHKEATRYFMTISEAAQLVLEAGAIGEGGEIMILDMGEPIRIFDLAVDMITLSGFEPHDEIPIAFTGLRPGEKLFEQLELSSEQLDRTLHPKVFIGRLETVGEARMAEMLERLDKLVRTGAGDELRSYLGSAIPEASLAAAPAAQSAPPASDERNVVN